MHFVLFENITTVAMRALEHGAWGFQFQDTSQPYNPIFFFSFY